MNETVVTLKRSPFKPGSGLSPPTLAGRAKEQSLLQRHLDDLAAGEGAARDVILVGPRGNGKTALLNRFKNTISAVTTATGKRIDVVSATPEQILEPEALLRKLIPEDKFKPDEIGFDIKVIKAAWSNARPEEFLADALVARCRKQPLILLVDEAHTLDPQVGRALLNASQSARQEAPFLLVLAGTPRLPDHLDSMEATFWDRGKQVGIGLLTRDAAAEALTQPFEREVDIDFDDDALNDVLSESQHYPYFLQLWGDALWAAAATDDRRQIELADPGRIKVIGMKEVNKARPEFEDERTTYYEQRRRQLIKHKLLPAANAVGEAFAGRDSFSEYEVDVAIAGFLGLPYDDDRVLSTRETLSHMGYIWSPPGARDNYAPGIPSLMNYLLADTAKSNVANPGHP